MNGSKCLYRFFNDGNLHFPKVAYEGPELNRNTGWTDKNEKEIFEGDIIKFSFQWKGEIQPQKPPGLVFFIKEKAAFGVAYKGKWVFLYECYDIEVIGNVYQNDGLLY